MNADFLDAFERHWADAELLFNEQRWANADHLYGLAAECGLKRLMLLFSNKVDIKREDKKHINEGLRVRYEAYRSGHNHTDYSLLPTDLFATWQASQRYAHRSNFNSVLVEQHKTGAAEVRALIQKAKFDGLIP